MKRFVIFLIITSAVSFTLIRCKLEESYLKQTVNLNLTGWDLPDTADVSVPFNLIVSSSTENSCYGKIDFKLETINGKEYVYASSNYLETGSGCSILTTYKDSIVNLTINQAGKHYYYFLKENKWNKDSIEIVND